MDSTKKPKKDSKKMQKSSPKNIWYEFYFKYLDIKNTKKILKYYFAKDKAESSIDKSLGNKCIQEEYFKVILPLLLNEDRFIQQYLNVSLQHRQIFTNSQNTLRFSLYTLEILSYKKDTFFYPFVKLAKINEEINEKNNLSEIIKKLDSIKEIKFEDYEEVKETIDKVGISKILESSKQLLEIKYKLAWHITYIRAIKYGDSKINITNDKNKLQESQKQYEKIIENIESGLESLSALKKWDYDIAMQYITLEGYRFIGARVHYIDLDRESREIYQKAFEDYFSFALPYLDSISHNIESKQGNSQLKDFLQHPHIQVYILYYYFLYLQRKFEDIAIQENSDTQSFIEFKKYVFKAKDLIELLDKKLQLYNVLYIKIKKHKSHIYNIIWHIELRELLHHTNNPFNIESTNHNDNILQKHKLREYINKCIESSSATP